MPSTLPKIVVRAAPERIEAWEAAKGPGESMNSWAGRILDAAAGVGEDVPPAVAKPTRGRALSEPCSRERHHRLGVFCKECGAGT